MDFFRNPTPLGLVISVLFLAIPFLWPVSLYMWLRYATGHRGVKSAKQTVSPTWGAPER